MNLYQLAFINRKVGIAFEILFALGLSDLKLSVRIMGRWSLFSGSGQGDHEARGARIGEMRVKSMAEGLWFGLSGNLVGWPSFKIHSGESMIWSTNLLQVTE